MIGVWPKAPSVSTHNCRNPLLPELLKIKCMTLKQCQWSVHLRVSACVLEFMQPGIHAVFSQPGGVVVVCSAYIRRLASKKKINLTEQEIKDKKNTTYHNQPTPQQSRRSSWQRGEIVQCWEIHEPMCRLPSHSLFLARFLVCAPQVPLGMSSSRRSHSSPSLVWPLPSSRKFQRQLVQQQCWKVCFSKP